MAIKSRAVALLALLVLGFVLTVTAEVSSTLTAADIENVHADLAQQENSDSRPHLPRLGEDCWHESDKGTCVRASVVDCPHETSIAYMNVCAGNAVRCCITRPDVTAPNSQPPPAAPQPAAPAVPAAPVVDDGKPKLFQKCGHKANGYGRCVSSAERCVGGDAVDRLCSGTAVCCIKPSPAEIAAAAKPGLFQSCDRYGRHGRCVSSAALCPRGDPVAGVCKDDNVCCYRGGAKRAPRRGKAAPRRGANGSPVNVRVTLNVNGEPVHNRRGSGTFNVDTHGVYSNMRHRVNPYSHLGWDEDMDIRLPNDRMPNRLPNDRMAKNVFSEDFRNIPEFSDEKIDQGVKVSITDDEDKLFGKLKKKSRPGRPSRILGELSSFGGRRDFDDFEDDDEEDLRAALLRLTQQKKNGTNSTVAPKKENSLRKFWNKFRNGSKKAGKFLRNLFRKNSDKKDNSNATAELEKLLANENLIDDKNTPEKDSQDAIIERLLRRMRRRANRNNRRTNRFNGRWNRRLGRNTENDLEDDSFEPVRRFPRFPGSNRFNRWNNRRPINRFDVDLNGPADNSDRFDRFGAKSFDRVTGIESDDARSLRFDGQPIFRRRPFFPRRFFPRSRMMVQSPYEDIDGSVFDEDVHVKLDRAPKSRKNAVKQLVKAVKDAVKKNVRADPFASFNIDSFFAKLDKTSNAKKNGKKPSKEQDELDKVMAEVSKEFQVEEKKPKKLFDHIDLSTFFTDRKPSKKSTKNLAVEVVDTEAEAWAKLARPDSETEGRKERIALTRKQRVLRRLRKALKFLDMTRFFKKNKKAAKPAPVDKSNDDDLASEFFAESQALREMTNKKNKKNPYWVMNEKKTENRYKHDSSLTHDEEHLGTEKMFGHFTAAEHGSSSLHSNDHMGTADMGMDNVRSTSTEKMFGQIRPNYDMVGPQRSPRRIGARKIKNNALLYRIAKVPNAPKAPKQDRKPAGSVYSHGAYIQKKYNGNGKNSGKNVGMVGSPKNKIKAAAPRTKVKVDETVVNRQMANMMPIPEVRPILPVQPVVDHEDLFQDQMGDFVEERNENMASIENFAGDDSFLAQEDQSIQDEARSMFAKRALLEEDNDDEDFGVADEDFDIDFENDDEDLDFEKDDEDLDEDSDEDEDEDFDFDEFDEDEDVDEEDVDAEADVDEEDVDIDEEDVDIDVEFDSDDDFDAADADDEVDDESDQDVDEDEDDDVNVDEAINLDSNTDDEVDLDAITLDNDVAEVDDERDVDEEDLDADADIDADLADFNDAEEDADDEDFDHDVNDDDLAK